jgi:hypothetical protein
MHKDSIAIALKLDYIVHLEAAITTLGTVFFLDIGHGMLGIKSVFELYSIKRLIGPWDTHRCLPVHKWWGTTDIRNTLVKTGY